MFLFSPVSPQRGWLCTVTFHIWYAGLGTSITLSSERNRGFLEKGLISGMGHSRHKSESSAPKCQSREGGEGKREDNGKEGKKSGWRDSIVVMQKNLHA